MSFLGTLLLTSGVEENHVEITEKKQGPKQPAWKSNSDGKPEIIEVL
ncbi:MAG: hypothetical protein V1732_01470 [Patescibacteria group bacterium]